MEEVLERFQIVNKDIRMLNEGTGDAVSGVLRTLFGCLFSSIATQSCLASCLLSKFVPSESLGICPLTQWVIMMEAFWTNIIDHPFHWSLDDCDVQALLLYQAEQSKMKCEWEDVLAHS